MSEQIVDEQEETVGAGSTAFPSTDPISQLASAIVTGINASQGPKKIGISRYMRERSVHRGKPFLNRKTMQNGRDVKEDSVSADAIEMCNQLKPGVYCGGLLTVVPMQNGSAAAGIDIQYSNKSVDPRMNLQSRFPTFEHMVAAILREQEGVPVS